MSIAGATQSGDEFVGTLDRLGELFAGDLEPSCVVVVADTKSAEAKAPDGAFGVCHLAQFFDCYRIAVGEARRKTGDRRLIPGAQSQFLGKQADFRFGQADLLQWTAYAEIPRGSHPRPEIIEVVHV